METLLQAVSTYSAAAVSALLSSMWEGLVLAAGVWICLRLFPGLSAAARSVVWLNVFVLIALLHFLPSLLHLSGSEAAGIAAGPGHTPIELDLRWSLGVAAVWALLSLVRGGQLLMSAVKLRGLVRRATPIETDETLRGLLNSAGRTVRLCASDEVERPSVCGFFRPRILTPPDLLAELSQEELRQVVIHEMEHLRRGDDWTNLLQKICLVLFPIHPVLLWVERRVCAERELACDDSVLRSSCGRKAYARCLTHLAEHAMVRRGYALVLGAWERRPELVRRVHRILRRPTEGMSAWRAKLVTAGLMAAVLAGTAALARCPQLVSFAPAAESTMQASDVQAARALESGLQRAGFDSNRPKAQLVKAVLPGPTAKNASGKKPVRAQSARRLASPEFAQTQQTFVVLTEWGDEGVPPRVVFAVAQNSGVRYAAVAVANGWLIVQI